MRRIDHTGEKHGKLTVSGPAPSKAGHSYWHCSCECGTTVSLATTNIRKTFSCGCGKEDYLGEGKWMSISGRRFGYFWALEFIPKSRRADGDVGRGGFWVGICTGCSPKVRGVQATTTQLKSGAVKGCTVCGPKYDGSLDWRTYLALYDGVKNTKTLNIYRLMVYRCADLTDMRYGGRGIRVCDRWLEADGQGYKNFVKDMRLRPHGGMSLERHNNDGDYSPENCLWADDPTQRRNKSTSRQYLVCGEWINQCDLAAKLDISDKSLSRRVERWRKNLLTDEQIAELLSVELHNVQQSQEDPPSAHCAPLGFTHPSLGLANHPRMNRLRLTLLNF